MGGLEGAVPRAYVEFMVVAGRGAPILELRALQDLGLEVTGVGYSSRAFSIFLDAFRACDRPGESRDRGRGVFYVHCVSCSIVVSSVGCLHEPCFERHV